MCGETPRGRTATRGGARHASWSRRCASASPQRWGLGGVGARCVGGARQPSARVHVRLPPPTLTHPPPLALAGVRAVLWVCGRHAGRVRGRPRHRLALQGLRRLPCHRAGGAQPDRGSGRHSHQPAGQPAGKCAQRPACWWGSERACVAERAALATPAPTASPPSAPARRTFSRSRWCPSCRVGQPLGPPSSRLTRSSL